MTTQLQATNFSDNTLPPQIANVQIANSSWAVLNDLAVNTSGGFILINGYNFVSGCLVTVANSAFRGTTNATSTTFVSSSLLRVQLPAISAGVKSVTVTNPNGATAIIINGLLASAPAASWVTAASLGTLQANTTFTYNLSASYSQNSESNNYVLQAGSALPPNTSLASNGVLSGSVDVASNTTYNFVIEAEDFENQGTERTFSLTILALYPKLFVWGTPRNPGLAGGGVNVGSLGLMDSIERSSPTQVGTENNWKFISVGNYINAGVKSNGALWAWGRNNYGQLGLNDRINRSSPTQVGTDTTWETVSTTEFHMLATKTAGTLWTWGRNNNSGELGLNDRVDRSSPTQIGAGTDWSTANGAISIGSSGSPAGSGNSPGSAAIKTGGTLWMWGNNSQGQLGINSTVNRSSPIQVGAGTDWRQVEHNVTTHAIKTGGTLWAWGSQDDGQLGLNVRIGNLSSPVQIGTGTDWSSLAVSNNGRQSFGIKTNGTLWAWGSNIQGRLGLNDTIYRSSPTQVGAGTNWSLATNGGSFGASHGIKTDGTLWSWGPSGYGLTALNISGGNRSSPTQVGTNTNWLFVGAGRYHGAALTRN